MASTEQSRIIFGIDFGTTYSGVSYVQSNFGPESIRTIARWPYPANTAPDNDVSSDKKTPTTLWYPGSRRGVDDTAIAAHGDEDVPPSLPSETAWGYAVPPGLPTLRWFKLLLLDDIDLQTYLSPGAMSHLTKMRDLVKESGKDVIDIVADFLRHLWKHTLNQVASTLGRLVVEESPFTVVVTVPAMWKRAAKNRMRAAVMKAGILDKDDTNLHFIPEPEAAALARLHDLRASGSVREGDCLTVVDFGGGTVDIISYEVTSENPFAVREVVEGKGGLCGAIFLDQAFRKKLIENIGPEIWDKIPRDEAEYFIEQQWERGLKRVYTRGRPAAFMLPGRLMQETGQTRLRIDANTLQEFFTTNTVIAESLKLIEDQVAAVKEKKMGKPPKYVVLAGGFGASLFLKEEIERELGINSETQVIQGGASDIWEAVSKGAAMSVSEGTAGDSIAKVEARISRACYGFKCYQPWVDGRYDERDKSWCDVRACYLAKDQFEWFLKKGDVVLGSQPFELSYYYGWKDSKPGEYPNLTTNVYTFEGYEPPKRLEPGVVSSHTMHHRSDIPFQDLPRHRNPKGKFFRRLDYTYTGMCHGDSIDMSVIINGNRTAQETFDTESDVAQATSLAPQSDVASGLNQPPPPGYTPYDSTRTLPPDLQAGDDDDDQGNSSPSPSRRQSSLLRALDITSTLIPDNNNNITRPPSRRPMPYDTPPPTNPASPEPGPQPLAKTTFSSTNPFRNTSTPDQAFSSPIAIFDTTCAPLASTPPSSPPTTSAVPGHAPNRSSTTRDVAGTDRQGAKLDQSHRDSDEGNNKGKADKWLKRIMKRRE